MKKTLKKKLSAYSLLEMIASLAIVAVIMIMLSNILIVTVEISRKSYARSSVREEQNSILSKIEKDIRNSRYISSCEGENESAYCEVALDKTYIWTTCQREEGDGIYICKKNAAQDQILEGMSEDIIVNNFSIEEGLSDSDGKKTILITLVVSHKDPDVEVENQVRQILVSMRNYEAD